MEKTPLFLIQIQFKLLFNLKEFQIGSTFFAPITSNLLTFKFQMAAKMERAKKIKE